MTPFPNSPRLIKGAIVGIDIFTTILGVILFQYDPDTLTHRLQARTSGDGGNKSEALRLEGASQETISLDIEIDATDQLEKAEGTAVSMGIYPQLSALEMLIYPKSSIVIANLAMLAADQFAENVIFMSNDHYSVYQYVVFKKDEDRIML